LTGLPPTLAEVDAFLKDTSPDAYEKVVDRLLASPRYGERMVLDWLDAARYADSNGYQQDRTRTNWPWRDGVIRAMNANMPFDQFTIEQLAGDLLPNATPEQKIATAFNRNHPLNGEGGRIAEESRVDYVVDRVDTTATVWMGLTLGCARCHDHKYDAIPTRDYYRLQCAFTTTKRDESLLVPRAEAARFRAYMSVSFPPSAITAWPMWTNSVAPSPITCTPNRWRVSLWNSNFNMPTVSPIIWPRAISR
jgi:hypothetical protein